MTVTNEVSPRLNCEDCRFWLRHPSKKHNLEYGICRRQAPVNSAAPGATDHYWPVDSSRHFPEMHQLDWCGEFECRTPRRVVT